MTTLGNKTAPHLYRIGVEPQLTDDNAEPETHVEVRARTRWSAMVIAERAGYVVRDCNMIG